MFKNKRVWYILVILLLLAGTFYLKSFQGLLSKSSSINQTSISFIEFGGTDQKFDEKQLPPGNEPPPFQNHPSNFGKPGGLPHTGNLVLPPSKQGGNTTSLFLFVVIIGLSTSLAITKEWQTSERRAAYAEIGKANAELSFLKAQINPHFLLNPLNNIYSLAVEGDINTAESIMKLLNIMRYVTDEVLADFVPLENGLECIDNYIDLQRFRIGEMTKIDYIFSGDANGKEITPLIFMTFIENIFKYGISKQENSKLIIKITIAADHIKLFCSNPVYNNIRIEVRNGIGIQNTIQRLDQLYCKNYKLNIDRTGNFFTVELTLNNKV
ncbi:sensor histidine kinase [Mucilaginibacter sp.]|uniref:sensor histidine kinase n=1 Tax=Mucilaginibacter sp. TaxID=1882438 RepID=UPI003B0060F3